MFIRQIIAKNPFLFSKIYNHSFNLQLNQGTLNLETFKFYLEQDALYLRAFSVALHRLSLRFTDRRIAVAFQFLAKDMIAAELAIHSHYLERTKPHTFFSTSDRPPVQKIPIIRRYANHLLVAVEQKSLAEAVFSCVPCFLIYRELGIKMNTGNQQDNPYYSWIASYSGQQFVASTTFIIETADELAAAITCPTQRERMTAAFLQSALFEYYFFDAAFLGKKIANPALDKDPAFRYASCGSHTT